MLPKVIGHRGAAFWAPENTLAGLYKAAELGCQWVEFDVRLTADNQLVMIHDSTADRTTTGAGRVRELSLAALEKLDAGAPFDPAYSGERVPALSAVIVALNRLNLRANIEIKCDPGDAEAAAGILVRQLEKEWTAVAPPLISSFDHDALAVVRQLNPTAPIGVLVPGMADPWEEAFDALSASTLHVGDRGLEAAQIADALNRNIEIGVYTVNDPERARELFDWGISGVFSDAPDTILAVI